MHGLFIGVQSNYIIYPLSLQQERKWPRWNIYSL